MRFYADRERRVAPRLAALALRERLRELDGLAAGAARHAELAALLVAAGGLAQGVADAERAAAGADVFGPGEQAVAGVTFAVARALWTSWRRGGAGPLPPPAVVDRLLAARLPDVVSIRRPEGFALYGLYPETYAAAGRILAGAGARVLGIRSIGTTLAAMVAAGAEGLGPVASVRPGGHPFARRLQLTPALAARLALAGQGGPVAIADEGPGQSGSSFLAAVDTLVRLGVHPGRLHVFPSHPGPPGDAASPEARRRYVRLSRHHVPFEALFLSDAPLALARLVEDLVGPIDAPPIDLSAGRWRAVVYDRPQDWPPTEGWRERRKYLFHAGGRAWIARFAGVGETGERALTRARALTAAGLVPAAAGLRHGFLVEAFAGTARPLPLARVPRARILDAAARHLGFVAARFPAPDGEGAAPGELAVVAEENARELLGGDAALALRRVMARRVREVERCARAVAVDGRLQRWEWLVEPDGRILKADALDHHADHALVGCQDALWDVAGAVVELGLGAREAARLAAAVREAAPGAPPRCLPFFLAAYAAFEAGRWSALAGEGGLAPDEAARRCAEAARLLDALRQIAAGAPLEGPGSGEEPVAHR